MKRSDSHEVSQLNELKIDNSALAFVQHYVQVGDIIMDEQMPIYGGYAGGMNSVAISNVSTHINAFVMSQATWHLDGPVHVRWGITTAREALILAGAANVAMEEKTHTMTGNQYYPIAGPDTLMCLLESAAQAIVDTGSGREVMSGVASAKGVYRDYYTGMEARAMAEAAKGVRGFSASKINEILDNLVKKYEEDYATADKGKRFFECYDVETVTPNEHYLKVYDQFREEMEGLGLHSFDDVD